GSPRTGHFGHPRLGLGPRLRLGQPPPRGREGHRVHGGDRAAAGLGPLGQDKYASSLAGAAFRGRRGDGPARQLLHREDPAGGHLADPLRRGDGAVPTAVRRARRGRTLTWPRQIPIEGEPADVVAIVAASADWLSTGGVPKLFFRAEPGAILANDEDLAFIRRLPALTEVKVAGRHYVQEDSPDEIG